VAGICEDEGIDKEEAGSSGGGVARSDMKEIKRHVEPKNKHH
jgi:hypothetical protein